MFALNERGEEDERKREVLSIDDKDLKVLISLQILVSTVFLFLLLLADSLVSSFLFGRQS